ncbi:hypothetical protein QL285_029383 [Trifolium repens]|nr:hypothetical protein QL285_029383 [Trifolium repens]
MLVDPQPFNAFSTHRVDKIRSPTGRGYVPVSYARIRHSLFYLQFTLVGLDFANNSLRTHFEMAFRISMIIKLKD